MSRAERLLQLLEILRTHRRPVQGKTLADDLGISVRTLYRDIASLQAQGAPIVGEAGIGYVLRPGFTLPPLMFSVDELEALILGSRWVIDRTDDDLADAARHVLAKISAVLPAHLRTELDTSSLLVGPGDVITSGTHLLPSIRRAIRSEFKLTIQYRDIQNRETERTIWPLALGFFDRVRILLAWCELRDALRIFRIDRIINLNATDSQYPPHRQRLIDEWMAHESTKPAKHKDC